MASNANPLVDRRHASDDGVIFNLDVTCQNGVVTHDHVVADLTVVGDVAVGHNEAIIPNLHLRVQTAGGVDRCKLPDLTVLSDEDKGCLTRILKVLRLCANTGSRIDDRIVTDGGIAIDVSVRLDDNAIS